MFGRDDVINDHHLSTDVLMDIIVLTCHDYALAECATCAIWTLISVVFSATNMLSHD